MKTVNNFEDQMKQILAFAKDNGVDLRTASVETIDSIMKAWLAHGKSFYSWFSELDINSKKSLLGLAR
jgi:hypothetical protein